MTPTQAAILRATSETQPLRGWQIVDAVLGWPRIDDRSVSYIDFIALRSDGHIVNDPPTASWKRTCAGTAALAEFERLEIPVCQ